MNKITTYLYIFCLILLFAGCTDKFVDLEPDDKVTPDIIYSTIEGIEGSIPGIFNQAREYISNEDGCEYKWGTTDLEVAGTSLRDDLDYNMAYLLISFDSENAFIKEIWDGYYKGLHKCNVALNSLDNLEINENDLSLIARRDAVIGVLYYFRAYFHLQLVQRWDNIVLADHLFSDPNEELKIAEKSKVYELIVNDLLTALPLLPEASDIATDRGHISKGVARITLAKAYMDISEWAKAAEMAEAVTTDPAYRLVALDEVFSVYHQDNDEVILSWQFSQGENTNIVQKLTCRWLPLYDRLQGVKRSFLYGGRPYARLSPSPYYWSLFEQSDLRLEAWHVLNYVYDTIGPVGSDERPPEGVAIGDIVDPNNFITYNGMGTEAFTPTTKKYFEDGSLGRAVGDAAGYRNIIQYRLGEAYMLAAEAYYRAGDIERGLPFINALRRRAGVSEYSTITDDIILDEHARELGCEGNRYEMLKRLGVLVQRVRAHNTDVGPVIQDFQVRWPIPFGFQKLTKVPQNEGYY